MAGTYADMATLAANATYRAAVKVALLKAAAQKLVANSNSGDVALARAIMDAPETYVERAAWAAACAVPPVNTNAPAVPSDADTLAAVQTVYPYLVR
jgi:hypothetical protein